MKRRVVITTDEFGGTSMWLWVRILGFIWLPDATLWAAKGYEDDAETQLNSWKEEYGSRLEIVDKRTK